MYTSGTTEVNLNVVVPHEKLQKYYRLGLNQKTVSFEKIPNEGTIFLYVWKNLDTGACVCMKNVQLQAASSTNSSSYLLCSTKEKTVQLL